MGSFDFNRRRIFVLLASIAAAILILNALFLTGNGIPDKISQIPLPGRPPQPSKTVSDPHPWRPTPPADVPIPEASPEVLDSHPITDLMREADRKWREYESGRSTTFKQTVEKYRATYGRHPPPGFPDWYKFARKKNVFHIDDFSQIMDDLRPFWAIEPQVIRQYAAHMWEDPEHGIDGIHIRHHRVAKLTNPSWRSDTLQSLIEKFVKYLPDMDIMMNRLDQPRVVVPWDEMQALLAQEYASRSLPPETSDSFTSAPSFLADFNAKDPLSDPSPATPRLDAAWFGASGKQYMEIASQACPPESPARTNLSLSDTDTMYKHALGGIVTDFNRSSDLCTVGPTIQHLHGFLYSASSITASHKLLPVFGECKVNVNSDILFPANMYWKKDDRYDYDGRGDVDWPDKLPTMVWRGVTSGGVQIPETWSTMHRQRLVQMLNGTHQAIIGAEPTILSLDPSSPPPSPDSNSTPSYHNTRFHPSAFATLHTDVGFTEAWGCIPADCPFYADVFSWKAPMALTSQFQSKYLIDVDGHSFSGRWRAFLESQSLGFKATIFREWFDSRLTAWRDFVPVDNRYDDLYALLTYFTGFDGTEMTGHADGSIGADAANRNVTIPSHDAVARTMAATSREWAKTVLRRDDIEVYMFRLLLEYGRVVDDRRDVIGYSGDGAEVDKAMEEEMGRGRWGVAAWFGSRPGTDADKGPGKKQGPY